MQCPSCQLENPEDAGFCGECGTSLAQEIECPQCGRANSPGQKFCHGCGNRMGEARSEAAAPDPAPIARTDADPRSYTPKHLADRILQTRTAVEGERKQVTVLFADVKGSMELTEELDPEEWHRILDRFFQILTEGVHRFEGTVNQYTGDGIMALFGAPIAHEDHAQRACYASLSLREALRGYADELRLDRGLSFSTRIGINSGEVVVGRIGDDLRMDYTAQGQTVGLAQRMESIAEASSIYLTQHTAALVGEYFALRDLGATRVKGLSSPIGVFELEGMGEHRTRLEASQARGFSKFVGRDEEMAVLGKSLEAARAGRGGVVGIVADAGTGKSRLCHEFAERCRSEGILVRHVYGVAHGKAIPLLPILELMRQAFGVTPRDTEAEARQKIAGGIVLVAPEMGDDLPLIFDFLGVPDPERSAPALPAEARHRRMLELVRRFALARGRKEPAIILFEDLHWIDASSDGFVEILAEAAEGSRTLLLANFRPEYRADWMHRSTYQQIALLPLDAAAIGDMLREWIGDDASLGGLAERLCERTGGTPFFVEEVIRSLIESGVLEGERGSYRLTTDLHEIEIPPGVHNLLAARIDRLSEREKRVLQAAAVVGEEFPEPLLAEITEIGSDDLGDALRALVQAEFVHQQALYPEVEYAFKHPLTQEVALGSLLRGNRARLHAALAKALERRHADELDEKAALLAHHWQEAGDPLAAATWHRRAAGWMGVRHATAAVEHYEHMRELAASMPESVGATALALEAVSQLVLYSVRVPRPDQEVDALLADGRALAERRGQPGELSLLLSNYAYFGTQQRNPHEYIEVAREARELALQVDDPHLRAAVNWVCSCGLVFGGRSPLAEAIPLADEIDELARQDPRVGGNIMGVLPSVASVLVRATYHASQGEFEEARRLYEHMHALALRLEDSVFVWISQSWPVMSMQSVDVFSPEEAAHKARTCAEWAERLGIPIGTINTHWSQGRADHRLGRLQEAVREYDSALEILRGGTWKAGLSFLQTHRALALLGLGDDRAREAMHEVRTHREELWDSPLIDAALARVRLGTEGAAGSEAALRDIERGEAYLQRVGNLGLEPEFHVVRAELARALGDGPTQDREVAAALEQLERMGAPWRADEIRRDFGG